MAMCLAGGDCGTLRRQPATQSAPAIRRQATNLKRQSLVEKSPIGDRPSATVIQSTTGNPIDNRQSQSATGNPIGNPNRQPNRQSATQSATGNPIGKPQISIGNRYSKNRQSEIAKSSIDSRAPPYLRAARYDEIVSSCSAVRRSPNDGMSASGSTCSGSSIHLRSFAASCFFPSCVRSGPSVPPSPSIL
jgi:hypothetical protein